MQFWSALEAYIERGESAVVVLVAHSTRHSPGTPGAKMFVTSSSTQYGTIGGGIMEAQIRHDALRSFVTRAVQPIKAVHLVHRKKGEHTSGLFCAGEQTNIHWFITPDMAGEISLLADFERDGRPGRLEMWPGGYSIGEGMVDPRVGPIRFQEGEDWRYTESIFEWNRATIVGGGHCGLALSRVLSQLGYHTTLIDTRADCPTIAENLYADEIRIVDDFSQAGAVITQRALQHVVVMTADVESDFKALLGISKVGPTPYLGVMGSPAKIRNIVKSLRDAGVSDDFVNSVRGPIGLRIKSNKPEEIAISVAAEFLQLREELFPYNKWAMPGEN